MRFLALAGGVAGAAALSQVPAFSDAYLQRLGGQDDALRAVVAAFDASAARAGLTREAALADLSGSGFRAAHQADMRATIDRAGRVAADLALLRAAGPLERLALPHRFRDIETLAATWADFQPALPASEAGAAAAGVGLVAGWAGVAALAALAGRLWRALRRPRTGAPGASAGQPPAPPGVPPSPPPAP
jgi:hypothetical protein